MKTLIIRAIIFMFFATQIATAQEIVALPNNKYRLEWGKSYKKTFTSIKKITRVGFLQAPVEVQVLSVQNLSTRLYYYYVIFKGYDLTDKLSQTRIGSINVDELDEVITFWKNLGDYIKDTSMKDYTEYEYQNSDKEMLFGAFFEPGNKEWKLVFRIDELGEPQKWFWLKPENISELYSALLNAKVTIERLKASETK